MKIERKKIGKLQKAVLFRTIFPVLIMCVAIIATTILRTRNSLKEELNRSLYATAVAVIDSYDQMYPGDYRLVSVGNGFFSLYKGEQELTEQHAFIDHLREESGMHISLIYKDMRILTTMMNEEGIRYTGTGVHATVVSQMEKKRQPLYYEVEIGPELYYACYVPIWNTDDDLVGMVATALTSAEVKKEASSVNTPILLITILGLLVTSFISIRYTNAIVNAIGEIHLFLAEMVAGNLNNTMPETVLKRRDEIGETGKDVLRMQNAVRILVECDPLTTLYNRRYGNAKLKNMQQRSEQTGAPFALAIGDIDFFKKVNDTYGHDAGDLVLKHVANELKILMAGRGHAVRWGGEEFLLIFEDTKLVAAGAALEEFLERIRSQVVDYGSQPIHVTMTIGLVDGAIDTPLEELIKQADEKLYYGKEHGRNQLVVTMDDAQPLYRELLAMEAEGKKGDVVLTFSDEFLDSENLMQLLADSAVREAENDKNGSDQGDEGT